MWKNIDLSLNNYAKNFDDIEIESNVIMNSNLFSSLLKTIERSSECYSSINFVQDINNKEGLSHTFLISCQDCTWTINFVTSKSSENKNEIIKGKKIKGIKTKRSRRCYMQQWCFLIGLLV